MSAKDSKGEEKKTNRSGGTGGRGGELTIRVTTWINPNVLCSLKETRLKGYIVYDFIYITFQKRQNGRGKKNKSVVARVWGMGGETDFKGIQGHCLE